MKLAEALILRTDCQKRIAQLKSRLLTNAKVQEDDQDAILISAINDTPILAFITHSKFVTARANIG